MPQSDPSIISTYNNPTASCTAIATEQVIYIKRMPFPDGLVPSTWLLLVVASVVFFVAGMLCLVKGQRNASQVSQIVHVGGVANLMMAFVGFSISVIVLAGFRRSGLSRDFFALFDREHVSSVLPWVVAFGALFFIGNMLFFNGLVLAPNAGYARAVMTIEVVAMSMLTALFFGSEITLQALIGIVFILTGVSLVSFS